ncbi:MAG: 50S ribosomal protein L31 [Candidatus Omnitrophota bacterium]|nr:50S ribosomal protein L31 [Candidatus Omnitrophota bacterium]
MKKGIHPEYKETTISCACGEAIHTRSTKPNIKVDICSKCHPFFTGKQKLVDSAGMVDKFKKRYEKAATTKRAKAPAASPAPAAGESEAAKG